MQNGRPDTSMATAFSLWEEKENINLLYMCGMVGSSRYDEAPEVGYR